MFISIAILVAFAVGLVGYYMASNGLNDGLEKTMETSGTPGSDPVYHAPLSYGDNYGVTLMMGGFGFALTILAVLGVMKLSKAVRSP
jgi:cobalt/nickel transport protein